MGHDFAFLDWSTFVWRKIARIHGSLPSSELKASEQFGAIKLSRFDVSPIEMGLESGATKSKIVCLKGRVYYVLQSVISRLLK